MSDALSEEKLDILEQAQEIADRELSGDARYTNVLLWDDGDFRIDVIHGMSDFRERISYRSNSSDIYPGEEFVKIVETMDVSEVRTTINKETVNEF